MTELNQPSSTVREAAREVKLNRRLRRLIPIFIGMLVALLALVYVISLLFGRYGSFTVSVRDPVDAASKSYSLSLSADRTFLHPVSYLNTDAVKQIDNIEGKSLPDNLNDGDGAHNGANYLAYTFYLKNTGGETCSYQYTLSISKKTQSIDDAVRVRVYYNPDFYKKEYGDSYFYDNSYIDYAKAATGGGGAPEVDPDNRTMTNFVNANTVMEGITENFEPGNITRITVVIWLEGWDPECVDDKLGGEFKVDMTFSVVN